MSDESREQMMTKILEDYPEDHRRIRTLENCVTKLDGMPEKINEIHIALIGTYDKEGIISKVNGLMEWRGTSTKRIKNRTAWIWSIVGGIMVITLDKIIALLHFGKP